MKELNNYLTPPSFFSFRSVRTLRSHLVKAKVYPVGERLVGSRKCNKNRCHICKNVTKLTHFNLLLIRRFIKLIIDLNVVINIWATSCRVRYMVHNITVELLTNSDTGGIIIRITIAKD